MYTLMMNHVPPLTTLHSPYRHCILVLQRPKFSCYDVIHYIVEMFLHIIHGALGWVSP